MRYQRKQYEVDAFQWQGNPNLIEEPHWAIKAFEDNKVWFVDIKNEWFMAVLTSEGQSLAHSGDYIFLDKGGLHVVDPETFERHFTQVIDKQLIQNMIDDSSQKAKVHILETISKMYWWK